MTGPQIAEVLCMPASTVGVILRRLGLGRLKDLEREEPPNRYERRHPGELIHVDVKKLGRIKRPGHRDLPTENSPGRLGGLHCRARPTDWSTSVLPQIRGVFPQMGYFKRDEADAG